MTTFSQAREAADTGMALAEDRANRQKWGWSDDALHGIELYCLAHADDEFLAEDVRDWCKEMGVVDKPDNGKAWGAVFKKAARLEVIRRIGYAPSKSSNLAPKCLWSAV